IKECQKRDRKLMEKLVSIDEGKEVDFGVDENGVVRYCGRVCVPDVPELKNDLGGRTSKWVKYSSRCY
ncbi:hypothetical protein A2U01_0077335, partial [Trifolium medium]|nr:hypothetical protein [Trifolium medium]